MQSSLPYIAALALLSAGLGGTLFLNHGKDEQIQVPAPQVQESSKPNSADLSWEQVSLQAEWGPRDSTAVVEFQDKLWLYGGINGNGYYLGGDSVQYWLAPHMADIWVSEDGLAWEQVTDTAPWGKRRSTNVASFQGKLWLMAGYGPKIGLKNDIWTSEDGVNWTKVAEHAPWNAREGADLLVFQDKLWLIGGVDYGTHATYNDVWVSDDGVVWEQLLQQAPWEPRWDHAMAVWQNKLWMLGGMDLEGSIFRDVWSSEDGIHWTQHPIPAWEARQGGAALVYYDRLWILGRFNDIENGGSNDVWFTKDGESWEKTQTDPPWIGREDHAAFVFQEKMWILGGMGADWEWKGDVWRSTLE